MVKVMICAGGTGGHINGALAIGEQFKKIGDDVLYVSGKRYLDFQLFKNQKRVIHLNAKALRGKNALITLSHLLWNTLVFMQSLQLILREKPKYVVGCGGYICGPTLFAAKLAGVKIAIIEQNAIAGMTNRLLSKISDKIFTCFDEVKGLHNKKIKNFGNPIRSSINFSENKLGDGIKILIFGGSLGASQINDMVEEIVKRYQGEVKLSILHQVGENGSAAKSVNQLIIYEPKSYIDDIGKAYDECNIIISRSGASTVSELRVVQRPVFIIPYPNAVDDHQRANANALAREDLFPVEIADKEQSATMLAESFIKFLDKLQREPSWLKPRSQPKLQNSSEKIVADLKHDWN